jgi:hypothetical protein
MIMSGFLSPLTSMKLGANVDAGVSGITAWQFDNFDAPVQVNSQEVTRHARRFVMPDVGIDLKRAWPSIAQVIQRCGEPGGHDTEHGDQGQGDQHACAEEKQRMKACTRPRGLPGPRRTLVAVALPRFVWAVSRASCSTASSSACGGRTREARFTVSTGVLVPVIYSSTVIVSAVVGR